MVLNTYLFVKLDKGWLKQLVDFFSAVVWVLSVTQGLALISLVW
jgi:hypothetical protein